MISITIKIFNFRVNKMDESNLKELLIEALNSEIKAKEFYIDASEKAQSQAGKEFFKELASFEENHFNKVKKIINSLEQGEKIEKDDSFDTTHKTHSEVEGEIEPNKDEIVDVINLAIEAEKNAQKRYRLIAKMLTEPDAKSIFEDLANEEGNHQRILEHQFYQISNKGTIIWE